MTILAAPTVLCGSSLTGARVKPGGDIYLPGKFYAATPASARSTASCTARGFSGFSM